MKSKAVLCYRYRLFWKVLRTSSLNMEQRQHDERSFQDISFVSDSCAHSSIWELLFFPEEDIRHLSFGE